MVARSGNSGLKELEKVETSERLGCRKGQDNVEAEMSERPRCRRGRDVGKAEVARSGTSGLEEAEKAEMLERQIRSR